jgi:signal transduction histidine kinase
MPTERILIVDDDPVILMLCQRILEADGYVVATVKRGEDALARLESEPFDLLLTDIRLPGLDGLQVTTRLRERNLDIVVITMTGYSNMEMAIQALSLGVDEFIVKPFTPDTLRIYVARAIDKFKLRRENSRLRTLVPLLQTAEIFAAARSRQQVFQALFDAIATHLRIDNAAVLSFNADTRTLTFSAVHGADMAALANHTFSLTNVIEPDALMSQEIQVWNQAEQPRVPSLPDDIGWVTSVALQTRDRVPGLVLVKTTPLSPSNTEYLHLIAAQAAAAIESVDLLEKVSHAYVTLRELDRLKGEFMNVAGHELRTPLAAILGNARLLRERTDGELRNFAQEVLTNAEHLHRAADDMLNLKFLAQGHAELRLQQVEVARVVNDVVNAYRSLATEKEQTIESNVTPETGVITADRAMLDLILGSIISNAIKFSPRQTRVRINAEGNPDAVTLSVHDEGKGLTPEEASHVFAPFYQAADSLTRQENGIGLGLTLTREMVRAHGGKIWVESRVNQGNVFYIILPRQARIGYKPDLGFVS